MNTTVKLGFIGLGRMGYPMVSNLLRAGYPVTVFDINAVKVNDLVALGASAADSPAAVANSSEFIFSMVMNDPVLLEVALGERGVLAGASEGSVFCDLSTVSPEASAKVAKAMSAARIEYIRGKVAGSVSLAEQGTLSVFASGNETAFKRIRLVLEVLGERVLYIGNDDTALYLKLVHSVIVGVYAALIGEALAFGEKGGLQLEGMLDILNNGPLASVQLALKSPMLQQRSFENPPSDIDTAAKDLDLVLAAARHEQVSMPLTAIVRQLMSQQQAAGSGKKDIWSILETFEAMSSIANMPEDKS